MIEDTHEIRQLKYKLKTLTKQSGRQGDTIHRLRAELAEVRELNSKIDRGDLRRLEVKVIDQAEEIEALRQITIPLQEKERLQAIARLEKAQH